jgi:hypothetical protein
MKGRDPAKLRLHLQVVWLISYTAVSWVPGRGCQYQLGTAIFFGISKSVEGNFMGSAHQRVKGSLATPRRKGQIAPDEIKEVNQQPIEGTSLAYSIGHAKPASRHTVQYYYIYGSRSVYDHGWAELPYPSAFTTGMRSKQTFDECAWELFNLNDDYTERVDLAKSNPRNRMS